MQKVIRVLAAAAVLATESASNGGRVHAQFPAVSPQVQHKSGQNIAPVYEGWYRTPDGEIRVSFGYFNRNFEETPDVPIGPENRVEPGPPDQGQPTHFLPRRQYGVFTVTLPKDAPRTEITWTLTVHGRSVSIPATLDPLYVIEPLKAVGGADEGNTPPVLKFDPADPGAAGPAGLKATLTASVSEPLTLTVWVSDDGLPKRSESGLRRTLQRPPTAGPQPLAAPAGLSVSWTKYRGPGTVTFSNATPPIEEGRATTTATFSEPGEYRLRALASDGSGFGGQCCWTNGYVSVRVAPATSGP